jgi:hypothetical protein
MIKPKDYLKKAKVKIQGAVSPTSQPLTTSTGSRCIFVRKVAKTLIRQCQQELQEHP